MLQIKHWLAPPVFQNDEAKTRRAVLLNAALINILTLVPVILIGNLIGGRTPLPVLGANAFAFAFCFVLFAWMRRGKVRLASIGLMIMGLVLVTASAASLGTIRAPTTAMYLLMVIMGGLLFDLGGMVTITALCSLLVGGLIGAENAGLLPRPDYSVTITQWIAYTAICGWTGSLTFSALQALRQALQRAQDEIAERQRVEHALRASEARYRLLYENSDDAILLTTPDGAILTANPAACRIFGRTEAEICQVGRAGVVDATDPRLPIALETRQRTGKFRGELTYLRRDGQPFPGEVTSVVFRDEDGQLRTSMIIRDITERKRAEQAQREAEVRYRALFEQTHDAVFILDLQGRHLATNQRAADLLGYSFEEMQKLSVGEISAELPESEAVLARLLRGEHIPVYERRFRKKNGEVVPVEINVERVCDANGNPTHIQSVARDITERKRMEKALRESEQRLQTIVETVPDGIMIMNREGRISFANDFAQRTLGLTPSALARRTYDDPRWKITTTDGKSFPREELPFARVMQTGKTALGIEHALQRPDGTRAILSVNASPWRDDSQKLVGVIASITDITERKRVEEALKESEEKLRLFIEYAPVALAMFDRNMRYVAVSRRWFSDFRLRERDLIGRSHYEIFPEIPDQLKAIHRRGMDGEVVRGDDAKFERADGSIQWLCWAMHPWKTADDSIGGIVIFSEDITERKRAEQERETLLQEIQHSREQLQVLSRQLIEAQENERRHIARELHDEVGQVMLAVKTNLETIQFAPEPATLNEHLTESVSSVNRALEQIRTLALNLRPSLLDDFGLVPTLEWFLERQARGAQHKINFHSDLPEMRLPAIIETTGFRVVQAALTNVARHAQARRVDVTLRWISAMRELELCVRDDGVGFDVPAALARARHGESLGLLGMQERVRLAGGAIAIDSTPGQGTEVRARFPIKDEG